MKKLFSAIALFIAVYAGFGPFDRWSEPAALAAQGNEALAGAFEGRRSDVQIEGQGVVVQILPDDNDGSRHQRFILRLDSGQTVLIAHNIDLAPRLPSLREGDTVAFKGEYESNPKGGVIHWTHRDPNGRRAAGWLKHKGRTYQ